MGPLKVVDMEKKLISVVQDGRPKRVSIDRCKVYNPPDVNKKNQRGFKKSDLGRAIT